MSIEYTNDNFGRNGPIQLKLGLTTHQTIIQVSTKHILLLKLPLLFPRGGCVWVIIIRLKVNPVLLGT